MPPVFFLSPLKRGCERGQGWLLAVFSSFVSLGVGARFLGWLWMVYCGSSQILRNNAAGGAAYAVRGVYGSSCVGV